MFILGEEAVVVFDYPSMEQYQSTIGLLGETPFQWWLHLLFVHAFVVGACYNMYNMP